MTRPEIAARLRAAMPYVVWDRHPGEGAGPTLLDETAAEVEKLMNTELDTAERALQARIDAQRSQHELAEAERAKWAAMSPDARSAAVIASLCEEVQRLQSRIANFEGPNKEK